MYVSDDGQIYDATTGKFRSHDTCNKMGYHRVIIDNHRLLVHRVVAMAFIPNPENKPEVNHKDCDVNNNRADNLEWATRKENNTYKPTKEKRDKWLSNRGENHNFAKLKEKEVIEILNKIKEGKTNKELGEEYGVWPETINSIRKGKSWKKIPRN